METRILNDNKDLKELIKFYKLQPEKALFFYDYIMCKSRLSGIEDGDDFFRYWNVHKDQLNTERAGNVKSIWRYDCTVVITKYISDKFSFVPGDKLNAGIDGEALIFNDFEFKWTVLEAIRQKRTSIIPMKENNSEFWNTALRTGKVQLPSVTISQILSKRAKTNRVASTE